MYLIDNTAPGNCLAVLHLEHSVYLITPNMLLLCSSCCVLSGRDILLLYLLYNVSHPVCYSMLFAVPRSGQLVHFTAPYILLLYCVRIVWQYHLWDTLRTRLAGDEEYAPTGEYL